VDFLAKAKNTFCLCSGFGYILAGFAVKSLLCFQKNYQLPAQETGSNGQGRVLFCCEELVDN
jgi:hypothetical protein